MGLKERIEEVISPVIAQENFELVDIECLVGKGNTILRLYIDKQNESAGSISTDSSTVLPSRITLDDCQLISQKISDVLDRENIVEDSYVLEISSPGLYRKIKKEKDFVRFLNQRVKVRTYEPIEGQRNFAGYIRKFEDKKLFFETVDNKNVIITLDKIIDVSLYPEIKI